MKPFALPALLLTLLAASCQQEQVIPPYTAGNPVIINQAAIPQPMNTGMGYGANNPYGDVNQGYIDTNNPDAAFEQQAQAYSNEAYAAQQSAAPYQQPQQGQNLANPYAAVNAYAAPATEVQAAAPNLMEQPTQNQNVGVMDYKVTITNGTPNRLFVEAQDASGAIYPCGHMQKGQSMSTRMSQEPAIKGPILLVVRDPDQPGAPELRRYRIAPPTASYANKTVHLTVIPKGRYSVAIDDQVCFISESED